ncbi:MAG: hypothetical protein AAF907_03865, partial [Planctomycetota bacterium]
MRFALLFVAVGLYLAPAAFGQRPDRAEVRQRLLDRFDEDGDGTLSAEERQALRSFLADRRANETDGETATQKDGLDRLYKAEAGPFEAVAVEHFELRDRKRDKELQLRITYPAEEGPFPLIVWSHGASGTKDHYQPIVRRWVSHGYVVIQANHSDSRALRKIDLNRRLDDATFRDWESRPEDIQFILDSIAALERKLPQLAGKINRNVIGVGGHSFGAHTAQLVAGTKTKTFGGGTKSHADERPKAFLLISPQGRGPQLDERAWDDFDRPALVMTGSNDGGRNGQGHEWRLDPYEFSPPDEKFLLFIQGAYHGFGGITGTTGMGNSGPANPNHVVYVQSTTTAFWDAYLKDDAEAKKALGANAIETLSDGEAKISRRSAEPENANAGSIGETSQTAEPAKKAAVDVRDLVWTDETRNREIPVRIYSPKEPARRFPGVVFSHGGGESREAYHYFGKGVAEQGYLVVVLSHPGSDRDAIESEGLRVLASSAFEDRPADVRFVIDRLSGKTPGSDAFAELVDPSKIAVAGHCAGGTTALAIAGMTAQRGSADERISFHDPQAGAVIALGPQPDASSRRGDRATFHPQAWSTVRVPALVVTGTRDFRWIPRVRNDPDQVNRPFTGM